jgi:hypothetical protein
MNHQYLNIDNKLKNFLQNSKNAQNSQMNQNGQNLKKIWQGNYTGIAHIMLQLQQLLHSQARAITAINALASSCIYL